MEEKRFKLFEKVVLEKHEIGDKIELTLLDNRKVSGTVIFNGEYQLAIQDAWGDVYVIHKETLRYFVLPAKTKNA